MVSILGLVTNSKWSRALAIAWLALVAVPVGADEVVALLKATSPGLDVEFKYRALTDIQRDDLSGVLRRKAYVPRTWRLYTLSSGEDVVGFAGQWRTMGKHASIGILVVCDSDFKVTDVRILRHSEKYGHGIGQRSFQRRFIGKGLEDKWLLWTDFDGITGATVSSKAVLNGAHDCLQCIALLSQEW